MHIIKVLFPIQLDWLENDLRKKALVKIDCYGASMLLSLFDILKETCNN